MIQKYNILYDTLIEYSNKSNNYFNELKDSHNVLFKYVNAGC